MLIHSPIELAQYYRDQRKQQNKSQTDVTEEVVIRHFDFSNDLAYGEDVKLR